jgi:DNA-binding CsgD family transcriptional regulator/PAS domain-containing protein
VEEVQTLVSRGSNPDPLLTLVHSIHESVGVDQLGANYRNTIPSLIHADAYGFYLLNVDSHKPERVAVRGAVERYAKAYEEVGYAYDPVLEHVSETGRPASDSSLFAPDEWQRQPLREALHMRKLARLLEAPVVVEGNTVGLLCFTRRSDDPPFTDRDIDMVHLISAHVRAAARHAVEFTKSQERCALLQAGLDVVNAPLLLSDRAGHLHYANKPAKALLNSSASSALRSGLLARCLLANLEELALPGQTSAVTVLPLERTPSRGQPCILVRSLSIPETGGAILNVLYPQDDPGSPDVGGPDLGYLSSRLPPRELEVLGLVARGMRNKEIAQQLFVSTNTVKYHLKRIFEALQVSSRSELLSKVLAKTTECIGPLN